MVADGIAKTMGVERVPWFKLTYYLTLLYAAVTCLVLFYREDFFNVTIVCMALYVLSFAERVTASSFRWLVAGVFFSLFVDLFWFAMKSQEYQADQKADGGLEKGIRVFSLDMSYISFVLRVVVACVYWKDSLDFEGIVQRGVAAGNRQSY